ncbi:hypothetical protein NMY22_g19149 [Coprinellus aureogranulatus]|nr:hypothetical protein NMY22_g19149 [Coprinellus aureogranulatus]
MHVAKVGKSHEEAAQVPMYPLAYPPLPGFLPVVLRLLLNLPLRPPAPDAQHRAIGQKIRRAQVSHQRQTAIKIVNKEFLKDLALARKDRENPPPKRRGDEGSDHECDSDDSEDSPPPSMSSSMLERGKKEIVKVGQVVDGNGKPVQRPVKRRPGDIAPHADSL